MRDPGAQGVRTPLCEAAGQGIGILCGSGVGGVPKIKTVYEPKSAHSKGGPAESSKEYYGGSGGDSPQAGGDGHHKV